MHELDQTQVALFPRLPDWLGRCAAYQPTRQALRCGDTALTFADLDAAATRLARQLATLGVTAGDRVALLARNGLEYATCVHALTRLGAVLVPLNLRLTAAELTWQLDDVGARFLLHDATQAALARDAASASDGLLHASLDSISDARDAAPIVAALAEADVALRSDIDLSATQAIIYTSGTTGHPKGALITYGMQWWNAIGSALNLGHAAEDCWLACLPFFHIGGLSILMRSVIYGVGVVVFERFDAAAVNAELLAGRVTMISVVAVMLQRMLDSLDPAAADAPSAIPADPTADPTANRAFPPTLRCVLLGGGPAPLPLLEACARRSVPVVQTYGMTESCSQAATLSPADSLRKLGSAGRPLAPVQLHIMGDTAVAPAGTVGEIELRGPTITPGYAGRPEATSQAFRAGWFATGDLGYLDADGYLYVLDRRADLILAGGENIYPAEVEAALLAHPDVLEAGVCGVPDATWGQVPVAFVQLRPGATASSADLLTDLAHRLARYKLPRVIHLTGALPRTASGKLLRRDLPSLVPPTSATSGA